MSKSVDKQKKIDQRKKHGVKPVAKEVVCNECGEPWGMHHYANPYECIRLLKVRLGLAKGPFDCSGFVRSTQTSPGYNHPYEHYWPHISGSSVPSGPTFGGISSGGHISITNSRLG